MLLLLVLIITRVKLNSLLSFNFKYNSLTNLLTEYDIKIDCVAVAKVIDVGLRVPIRRSLRN